MTRWTSRSTVELLALAVLVVVADGCTDCAEDPQTLHLVPAGPGTAAAHVYGSTSKSNAYVDARWYGTASNNGPVPCRIAVYEHASEPDAAAVPVLTRNELAPVTTRDGGVLLFDSLLPAAEPGRVLVRELNVDNLENKYSPGYHIAQDREGDDIERIDVWLTLATCDAPQVEVDFELIGEVCPGRASGSVVAETWWPR